MCPSAPEEKPSLSRASLEKMPSSPMLISMVIFFLELLAAMLQNGFIVTVLIGEWVQCQTLLAGDMIAASSLAASWFCLHGMALLNNLVAFFASPRTSSTLSLSGLLLGLLHSTWRISRSVPRLLLGSLILSGLVVIPLDTGNTILVQMVAAQSSHGNNTLAGRIQTVSLHFFLPHVIIMWSIPFLPFLVSTLSLVFSLCRHLGQMRDHRPGPE
eukprot:bmy_15496T0